MFKVGQKVICIDASKRGKKEHFPNWVKDGEVYTVRRFENSSTGARILLEEIKNPTMYFDMLQGSTEPGFSAKRFTDAEDYIMSNVNIESITEEAEALL